MSNIGREVRLSGRVIGTVVEDKGKKLRIHLADSEPRNPVLGDFAIVTTKAIEFADEPLLGGSGYLDMRQIARRQSYNR